MKHVDLKKVLVSLAIVSMMCAMPTVTAFGQNATEAAKAFLEKLKDATPTVDGENKAGLMIESVTKSGGDYIVNYKCTNNMIWGSNDNRAFLMTQIYFIDPENHKKSYQPFTYKEDGNINIQFKAGDEIGYPIRRIAFEPPSKVMYMYFAGVGSEAPAELKTVPLFFTIILGDNPYVYEKKPRHAGELFRGVEKKK